MAIYLYNAWETMNLPPVTGDTYFRISKSQLTNPGTDTTNVIYDGLVLDGMRLKNINEIISPYVSVSDLQFPTSGDAVINDAAQWQDFFIYYSTTPPGVQWNNPSYDRIVVFYNWTYNTEMPICRSYRPIRIVDYRQFFVLSFRDQSTDDATYYSVMLDNDEKYSFTTFNQNVYHFVLNMSTMEYNGAFSWAYSYDFQVTRDSMDPGTFSVFTIQDEWESQKWEYLVTATCYRYALYYVNNMGGWDYMLFRGKEIQTDQLTRLQYKQEYNAGSLNFGRKNYLTKLTESWELNTSFVDDNTSQDIQSLFSSNKMILHDLETGKLVPVNITNSSVEHKSYKNQGRKLYSYTINLTSSQDKFTC